MYLKRTTLSPNVEKRVLELWEDGWTIGYIAKLAFIHRSSVRKILKKYKKGE
jgi:hypothetical protein